MRRPHLVLQYGGALGLSALGLLAFWLSGEIFLQLAATSLAFYYGGKGPGFVSIGLCAAGSGLIILSVAAPGGVEALAWLVLFVVLASGIGLMVHDSQTVRESEASLRSILDNVPGMISTRDSHGALRFNNKYFLDYLGVDSSELKGNRWHDVVHPDDRDTVVAAWCHSIETRTPMQIRLRFRRHDGVYRWVETRSKPTFDEYGNARLWYTLKVDIDEQKKAAEALTERERELQQIVDAVPTPIWVVSADGVPTYISKKLQAHYGLDIGDLEEVEGSLVRGAIRARVHPDDAPAVETRMLRCFETGEVFAMTYRHLCADGSCRWVQGRAEPLRDQNGTILKWYGVVIDIEEEKRAREALLQTSERLARASQLANLAELSASIAHEVNQPLTAVIANSQACQRWLAADPPRMERARASVDRVVRDAIDAGDVVGRIRALFNEKATLRASININDIIGEVRVLMAERLRSEVVGLREDLDPSIPHVLADRLQIQQVLVNLVANALDAMKQNDGPRSLSIQSRSDGNGHIVIELQDNGEGVTDTQKIFEPFFTTKAGGMGMGLAVCRSILEAHGGRLWAERAEEGGASFSFALPIDLGRDSPATNGNQ